MGGDLLKAVRMLFSWNFQFRENGKIVGEMNRSLLREAAEVDLDDGRYSFTATRLSAATTCSSTRDKSSREPSRSGGGRISTSSSSNEVSSCEGRRSSCVATQHLREAGGSER